jgi:hypothetical protein
MTIRQPQHFIFYFYGGKLCMFLPLKYDKSIKTKQQWSAGWLPHHYAYQTRVNFTNKFAKCATKGTSWSIFVFLKLTQFLKTHLGGGGLAPSSQTVRSPGWWWENDLSIAPMDSTNSKIQLTLTKATVLNKWQKRCCSVSPTFVLIFYTIF